MKLIETNSDGRYGYEDSLSLDTGGESAHALKLRLARKDLLDKWDVYAESDANSLKEFYARDRKAQKVSPLARAFWLAFIALVVLWAGWTMVDAAFDWLWKGLGAR